jgi:pilus assembly protein CpaC
VAGLPQPQPVPDPLGKGPGVLPQPNPLAERLPRLGTGQLGTTPVPTKEDLAEFARVIGGVVDPKNTLDLVEGRSRVILLKAVPYRTQIADPGVAEFRLLEDIDVPAQSGKQMIIIGKRPGLTVLTLWFRDPDKKDQDLILSYLVRVLPDPELKERLEAIYRALEVEINKAFPNSRIRLTLVGDKVMITGQAHDVADADFILRVVSANAPGQGGAATRPPLSDVRAIANPFDPLRQIPTPGTESYITPGADNVINNMRIVGEQQVMLRVTVAEVSRAAARSIGLDWSITNNQGTQVFAQLTGGIGAPGGNLPISIDNGQIAVGLQALRNLSYARSLAEPNLVAVNGQTAFFLSGGQFPVPVLGGFGGLGAVGGLQGVQYIPFGVQLSFTPVITDRDRIRLTVQATVSTRDVSIGTNVGGANVPGLNARSFFSTVHLREGQTMAVAGLIQTNLGADSQRVPLFGDLPYVGKFFGASRISSSEQEVIILVTPEIVHPLEPSELGPVPGSDLFEPGDLEFYLAGRLESRRSYDYRSPVMNDIHRMLRYRQCEQIYIVGPTGHTDPPNPNAPPVGSGNGNGAGNGTGNGIWNGNGKK